MSCGKPCECPTYRDHVASIGFSAAAMPTRRTEAKRLGDTERNWDKDMAAYKRLRQDGLQPHRIDDCAAVEAMATTREHVEGTAA